MPHTCAVIVKPLPCMVKCVGADAADGPDRRCRDVAVGVGVGVAVGNATGCAVVLGAGFGAEEEHAPRLECEPEQGGAGGDAASSHAVEDRSPGRVAR